MALTPGLRPFSEDTPSRGDRLGGRVKVDDRGPRMPSLKPTASPVETYTRPQKPPVDNDLKNLAEGLASLNPALSRFAAVREDDPTAQQDTAAKKWAAAKTPEERNALLKDPDVQGKFAQQFLGKLQAQSTGDADQTELFRLYNEEIDKNGSIGDINQFVDGFVAKRVQDLGGQGAASGYLERMVGVKKSLVEHHQKLLTEGTLAKQQETVEDGILSNIRNVIDLDAPDATAVTSVQEILKTNKLLNGKPFKEQQAWVLSAVEKLTQDMERNPDKRGKIYSVIESLLDGPREGEDGVSRRMTEGKDGVGAKAQQVLTQAKRKLYELNNQHGYKTEADLRTAATYDPHNLSEAAVQKAVTDRVISPDAGAGLLAQRASSIKRLEASQADFDAEVGVREDKANVVTQAFRKFEKGELNGTVEPAKIVTKEGRLKGTGETTTVSSEDIAEELHTTVQNQLRAERDYLISQNRPEAEVDAHIQKKELNLYSANGFAPPAWKREFKSAMRSITTAVSTAKALPPETIDAFKKYQTVKNQHPNIIRDVVDEDTREFFDIADVATQDGYGRPEDALSVAANYFARRDDKVKAAEAVTRKAITEQMVAQEESSLWNVTKRLFGEPVENAMAIGPQVAERAAMYVQAMGMKPEAAIEAATKNVRKHTAVVNGYVIDTNSKNLGPDFEKRAEKYLDLVFNSYKENLKDLGVSDRRDLVITRNGNSDSFRVTTKSGHYIPEPVMMDIKGVAVNGQFLTPQNLESVGSLMRDQEVKKAVEAAQPPANPIPKAYRAQEILKPENVEQSKKNFKEGLKKQFPGSAVAR